MLGCQGGFSEAGEVTSTMHAVALYPVRPEQDLPTEVEIGDKSEEEEEEEKTAHFQEKYGKSPT